MWIFGLDSVDEWVLSGDSSGELACWCVDLERYEAAVGVDDALTAPAASKEDGDGPAAPPQLRRVRVKAHASSIYSVLACPGGRVVTGADEEIRVWRYPWLEAGQEDPAGGEDGLMQMAPLGELRIPQLEGSRGSKSPVAETNGVAVLEGGAKVAAAAGDGNAYLFDTETNSLLRTWSGHKDYLHCVAAVQRTGVVVTGSEDGTCMLWDARQSRPVATLEVGEIVSALSLSEDSNWIAIGGAKGGAGQLSMCHLASRTVTEERTCSSMSRVQSLRFTQASLVAGGEGQQIEYWSKNAASHVVSTPTSSSSVFGLAYNPSAGLLYSAGSSDMIDVFSEEHSQMMSICTSSSA